MAELTFEEVSKVLRADFETGKLYWLKRDPDLFKSKNVNSWNTRFAGKEALATINSKGYMSGRIHGRPIVAHRVIMLLANGHWPSNAIDHINGIRADNRLQNLRNATHVENGRNQKMPSHNKTGVVGVSWDKKEKKWHAQISVERKRVYLGHHAHFEDAIKRRKEAELLYGFHENHGRHSIALQSEER